MTLKKEYLSAMKKCALFNDIDVELVYKTLEDRCTVCDFLNGETVYTRSKFNDSVGIVLEGSIEIYKDEDRAVMLNRIGVGGFFGAAALFANKKEYVSVLVAKGKSTVMFIPFDEFKTLLAKNSTFALNYIGFLSGRIEFLNKKIDEFTAQDTNQKLCRYLIDNASKTGGKWLCSIKSMVELSKKLNMGRASLYRAFEELENEKIITRIGKNIIIDDIDKLKERGF